MRRDELIARERLRELFRGAHYVDIVVRRNGRDERHEGDFLKVLALEEPSGFEGLSESGLSG